MIAIFLILLASALSVFALYIYVESTRLKKEYYHFLAVMYMTRKGQLERLDGSNNCLKEYLEFQVEKYGKEMKRIEHIFFFTTSDCHLWQEVTKENCDGRIR